MNIQDAVVVIPGFIAVVIFALKKALGATIYNKFKNYTPLAAMLIGAVISGAFAFAYDLTSPEKVTTILQGFVIGAAAVGYREVVDKLSQRQ